MEIFFLPGETLFIEFQLSNGSGWLTSHRLILCKHPHGQLKEHTPTTYPLKDFQKSQIKRSTLIVQFRYRQKVEIKPPESNHSLLQEIKNYIEKASLIHHTDKGGEVLEENHNRKIV